MFFGFNPERGTAGRKLDAKSDLYIYFYFHGLSLLNPKGSFCFITFNSWLDSGYGKDLQEFLLKHCNIKMIISNNQVKRSFKQADVNTIIALLSLPDESSSWGLDKTARFVMFKAPFERVLSPIIFGEIEEATERTNRPEYRVYPISQKELLGSGWEWPEDTSEEKIKGLERFNIGKYIVNKWGGKYLRAPEIYWTILEKGKSKLMSLK